MAESRRARQAIAPNRWLQLGLGIICMSMIANLQYGWTLFVDPIDQRHGWGRAAIQIAFSVFVFTETWLVPIEGWFVDRYGPRIVVMFGGVLVAAAWVVDSFASSLAILYAGAVIAGVGAGAVYGTCVGNALKWFPDRRGLAAGATAAGFGAGAALTVVPIAETIASFGYQTAFLVFGLGQGVIIVLAGCFLRAPGKGALTSSASTRHRKIAQTQTDLMPMQVMRQPVFWLMYLMFVAVASGGLMAAAQIGPIARDYGIATVPLDLFGLVMPALTLAISLDRILDGFGRPFFGWVSDNIGRENTMFIAFVVAALSLLLLTQFGHSPWMFVVLTALFFGVFGEIYSLFPATCGDTFGSKYAATNAGMLYTAKGTASALVPLASLAAATYGWSAVFAIAVAFNVCAALLALFVLKPLRAEFMRSRSPERSGILIVGASDLASETEPAPAMGFAVQSSIEAASQQQAVTLTIPAKTSADAAVKLGRGLAAGLGSGPTDLSAFAYLPRSRRPAR